MLLVFADGAVAVAHVAPKFPGLPLSGLHVGSRDERATVCFYVRESIFWFVNKIYIFFKIPHISNVI